MTRSGARRRRRLRAGWRFGVALMSLLVSAAPGAVAGSVFARDGVGEWLEGYDLRGTAVGATAIGVSDAYNAFSPNAATAAACENAVGHVGFSLATRWSSDGERTARDGSSSFEQMGLYVPLAGGVGLRAVLRPLTDGDYTLEEQVATGSGSTRNIRREVGSRGLLQYGADLVLRATPSVALAAGVGVITGSLAEETTFSFADSGWAGSTSRHELRVEPTPFLSAGFLLRPVPRLSVGGFVSTSAAADGRADYYAPEGASWEESRELEFPLGIGAGLSMQIGSRMRLSGDLIWRDWAEADLGGGFPAGAAASQLRSTLRWGVGIERLPSAVRHRSRWERLWLRAGFTWVPWYLRDATGDPIDEWRLSAGIGLPIQVDRGTIDLTFVWGQRGDDGVNGLSEKHYRLGLAFTFARVLREY